MTFLLRKDLQIGGAGASRATDLSALMSNRKDCCNVDASVLAQRMDIQMKCIDDMDDPVACSLEVDVDGDQGDKADSDSNTVKKPTFSSMNHDITLFKGTCKCIDCLKYRETIIQLLMEDFEYNILWDRLQFLIRNVYNLIPEDESSLINKRYTASMTKHLTKWLSNGRADKKKNIQLSLGFNLPLSNEMTFILVFSVLFTRDPHQLFELLCLQLRAIAIAYSEGLKEICFVKENSDQVTFNSIELLEYILDGYEKMCHAATTLSPLLFELQRGHLQQFRLTWLLLNKRMYFRWVYLEIHELIPECILNLKELLDEQSYKTLVYRFLRFDDEMTDSVKLWYDAWSLIQTYHMKQEDIDRRKQISTVQAMMASIKNSKFPYDHSTEFANDRCSVFDWMGMEDRQKVWNFAVYHFRQKFIATTIQRFATPALQLLPCAKCKCLINHYVECTCCTCIIAGGPRINKIVDNMCSKCCSNLLSQDTREFLYYADKIDMVQLNQIDSIRLTDAASCNGDAWDSTAVKSSVTDDETTRSKSPNGPSLLPIREFKSLSLDDDSNDPCIEWAKTHSYHLSWAVFKHSSSRQPYNTPNFSAEHFCAFQNPPCSRNECLVAIHIIAGLYPLNFSKVLIKSYQPLTEDERKELMTIQKLFFTYLIQKLCGENAQKLQAFHAMDLLWNADDTDYGLLGDMISAVAECYLTDVNVPLEETIDSCFLADGNDIELNMYWLECIYMFRTNSKTPLPAPIQKDKADELAMIAELKMQIEQLSNPANGGNLLKTKKILSIQTPFLAGQSLKNLSDIQTKPKVSIPVQDSHTTQIDENRTDETLTDLVDSNGTISVKVETITDASDAIMTVEHAENLIIKSERLTEAVKLAVNQKLNQKLEAELRTLKKEHSVLKDMVRDLEQIKENEEKQLKFSKEKPTAVVPNNHCCAEHAEFIGTNAPTLCHRIDGQCSCYYCTIFGHTECHHGRMNETRDRLRKRLHSRDSHKNLSGKNLKGPMMKKAVVAKPLLKKVAQTAAAAAANAVTAANCVDDFTNHSFSNAATTNTSVNLKVSIGTKRKLYTQNDIQGPTGIPGQLQPIIAAAAAAAASTIPANVSVIDNKLSVGQSKVVIVDQIEANKETAAKKSQVRLVKNRPASAEIVESKPLNKAADSRDVATSDTKRRLNQLSSVPPPPPLVPGTLTTSKIESINDILEYIEGGGPKRSNSASGVSNQKELEKKAAKKAKQKQKKEDIKRVEELEHLRIEFHELYFKELSLKTELKSLKATNKRKQDKKKIIDLDLGSKKIGKSKQRVEAVILDLIAGLKKNNPEFRFAYLPTKEQQLEQQARYKHFTQQSGQPEPINNQSTSDHQSTDPIVVPPINEIESFTIPVGEGTAQRMVTIRRLPSSPDEQPHVTVTAKGTSPDKDKLLYKFVNGQLVAANPGEFNALRSMLPSHIHRYREQHLQLRQAQLLAQSEARQSEPLVVGNEKENVRPNVSTSKGARKKELPQPKVESIGRETCGGVSDIVGESKKLKKEKKSSSQAVPKVETIADRRDSNSEKAKSLTVKLIKTNKSEKLIGKSDRRDKQRDLPNQRKSSADRSGDDCNEKPTERRKVKLPKFEYADPQYKVNKFDVLDMDDDDDIYISDVELDICAPAEPIKVIKRTTPTETVKKCLTNGKKNQLKDCAIAQNCNETVKRSEKIAMTNGKLSETSNASGEKLSRKQMKKLAQRARLDGNVNCSGGIDSSVRQAEKMAKSLRNPQQKLHLNSDTTIQLVDEESTTRNGYGPRSGISIMEQLNRGIKVEGLCLPPGITLTRVDPSETEALRARSAQYKKNNSNGSANQEWSDKPDSAVKNRSAPLQPINQTSRTNVVTDIGRNEPNGFIMVDTMNIRKQQQSQMQHQASGSTTTGSNKRSKKNNRRNKNKSNEQSATQSSQPTNHPPKVVTLRNPLFHNDFGQKAAAANPVRPTQSTLTDQPAAIIKNENGMYTIRNPSLHHALVNGVGSNFRQYSSGDMVYSSGTDAGVGTGTPQNRFSYFSDTPPTYNHQSNGTMVEPVKPNCVAVGAERNSVRLDWAPTNVLQRSPTAGQGADIFNHITTLNGQSNGYGFNSDFVQSVPGQLPQPGTGYYGNTNGYGQPLYGSGPSSSNSSLFGTTTSNRHRCDDSPPPPSTPLNRYYDFDGAASGDSKVGKFDEFLQNLQPGQRLNSEVTIHNISEAKFNRNIGLETNGVEITPIPYTGMAQQPSQSLHSFTNEANLAVGSNRHRLEFERPYANGPTDFVGAENIFTPNQTLKLSDLESEEREIESFKRFDYYFEPPKHKPKVNFNVKDIVVQKKHTSMGGNRSSSQCSSPYFGESTIASGSTVSLNGTTTPIDMELYQAMHGLNISGTPSISSISSRPSSVPSAQRQLYGYPYGSNGLTSCIGDNFLHGVIGEQLKN